MLFKTTKTFQERVVESQVNLLCLLYDKYYWHIRYYDKDFFIAIILLKSFNKLSLIWYEDRSIVMILCF